MRDTTELLTQLDQSLQALDAALTSRASQVDLIGHSERLNAWLLAARDWLTSLQSPAGHVPNEGQA